MEATLLNQCVNVLVRFGQHRLEKKLRLVDLTSRYGKIAVDGSREHWSAWKFAGGWRGDGFVGIQFQRRQEARKNASSSSSSGSSGKKKLEPRAGPIYLIPFFTPFAASWSPSHAFCYYEEEEGQEEKKGRAATCRAEGLHVPQSWIDDYMVPWTLSRMLLAFSACFY